MTIETAERMDVVFGSSDFDMWDTLKREQHALRWSRRRRNNPQYAEHTWRSIAQAWCGFFGADLRWCEVFEAIRPYWKPEFLRPDDRVFYESLPDEIEVWRGCIDSPASLLGFSYTTSREKAEWFANRHKITGAKSLPVLLRGALAKTAVALALVGRREQEIIPFSLAEIKDCEKIPFEVAG